MELSNLSGFDNNTYYAYHITEKIRKYKKMTK